MTTASTKTANPFVENLPEEIGRNLRRFTSPEEHVLIQVAADMSGRHRYGESWLVVTDRRVAFLRAGDGDGDVQIPIEAVRTARAEALVGGGLLEVERKEGAPERLYYSNSLAARFGEVAEGIQQLAEGRTVTLPAAVERTRCERCARMLPEKDGVCPACVKKLATLRRLIGYMMVHRKRIVLLFLVLAAEAVSDLLPPLIVRSIIDDVLTPGSNLDLLWWLVAGLLAVNIVGWVTWVSRKWLSSRIGLRAIEELRADLYRSLQYLPLRFYDKRKVGTLISRMSNDADLVEEYLLFDLPYILNNALMVVGILGLLFYMNWELTLLVLLPVPPIVIGSSLIWNRMESYWQRWSAKWGRLSSHLNESIRGIRVVKAFAQERREGQRFDRRNEDLRAVSVSAERVWVVFFMITNFFMSFGVFFVWYFGGRQILGGTLELGELVAFITYLWMLYQPLKWFGEFYGFMMRAYAGAERIFEVIDTRTEPFGDPDALPMPSLEGRVRFDGLSFGYDTGKRVLKNIDFDVEPGEMIGLVGKSGAGKSTLINMICRFYDATRGSLMVDGVDIRDMKLEDLRGQIGLVAQQSFLFNGTIAENIAYGKPGAAFAEILRASRAANAHEFIIAKPDGYDMVVGEQGDKLSGGEKQRISIARAILHDPRILILDEATSSLDSQTEGKIQQAIARLVEGRTTFAIAHRLSTLRSADRLVVLDDGKVAEMGTHAELMERQGFFYNLVRTQQETTAIMAVSG